MVIKIKKTAIKCIMCKNAIKFPEYVGQDYGGDLLCGRCGSLLRIKLNKWEVKQYMVVKDRFEEWKEAEKLRSLQEKLAKAKYGDK